MSRFRTPERRFIIKRCIELSLSLSLMFLVLLIGLEAGSPASALLVGEIFSILAVVGMTFLDLAHGERNKRRRADDSALASLLFAALERPKMLAGTSAVVAFATC